jgi:hypothetical protein
MPIPFPQMWEARSVAPIRSLPLESSARWNAPPTFKQRSDQFPLGPLRGVAEFPLGPLSGGVAAGRGGSSPSSPSSVGADDGRPAPVVENWMNRIVFTRRRGVRGGSRPKQRPRDERSRNGIVRHASGSRAYSVRQGVTTKAERDSPIWSTACLSPFFFERHFACERSGHRDPHP